MVPGMLLPDLGKEEACRLPWASKGSATLKVAARAVYVSPTDLAQPAPAEVSTMLSLVLPAAEPLGRVPGQAGAGDWVQPHRPQRGPAQ